MVGSRSGCPTTNHLRYPANPGGWKILKISNFPRNLAPDFGQYTCEQAQSSQQQLTKKAYGKIKEKYQEKDHNSRSRTQKGRRLAAEIDRLPTCPSSIRYIRAIRSSTLQRFDRFSFFRITWRQISRSTPRERPQNKLP